MKIKSFIVFSYFTLKIKTNSDLILPLYTWKEIWNQHVMAEKMKRGKEHSQGHIWPTGVKALGPKFLNPRTHILSWNFHFSWQNRQLCLCRAGCDACVPTTHITSN